jgi:UDP-3-O-[3-hydroxymyristoyl] glucosamine N-acyltransferase
MTVNENLIPKSIFDGDFNETNIGWASESNIKRLYELDRGTVFVPKSGNLKYIGLARRTRLDLIIVDDPKFCFIEVLERTPDVEVTIIASKDVKIGDYTSIGNDGFGFYKGKRVPHRGVVMINSGVEIGNNVCIDRAVVGKTDIGFDVKIDNLVHIAHGVKIGNGSTIVAGAVICGSVTIGENVWVGANACIRQHLTIGDNAVIGMGSVVVKDVLAGQTVVGNPAKQLSK